MHFINVNSVTYDKPHAQNDAQQLKMAAIPTLTTATSINL